MPEGECAFRVAFCSGKLCIDRAHLLFLCFRVFFPQQEGVGFKFLTPGINCFAMQLAPHIEALQLCVLFLMSNL